MGRYHQKNKAAPISLKVILLAFKQLYKMVKRRTEISSYVVDFVFIRYCFFIVIL